MLRSTTLPRDPPGRLARTSCGFCEGAHGQPQGRWYDVSKRCKGTCYRAVPAFTSAAAMATLARARGGFDSGEAVDLPPAAGAQAAPQRHAQCLGDRSPIPGVR